MIFPTLRVNRGLGICTHVTVKSFHDGAVAAVLQTLLDGSNRDTGFLSEVELLADFLLMLKCKRCDQVSALKPSRCVLDLLRGELEDDDDVTLSPLSGFSTEVLSIVLSTIWCCRYQGALSTG